MTGTPLKPVPSRLTTWKRWKKLFPHTLVLSPKTGYARDYNHDPYAGYSKSPFAYFRSKKTPPYLPKKELVLGIEIKGRYRAYPFSVLKKAASPVDDTFDGERLKVYFDRGSEEVYAALASGRRVPGLVAYWFVWYSFHPDTTIFKGP